MEEGEYVKNYKNQILKIFAIDAGYMNLIFQIIDKELGETICIPLSGIFLTNSPYNIKEVLSKEDNPEYYL